MSNLEQCFTEDEGEPKTSQGRNAECDVVTQFPWSKEGGDDLGYFHLCPGFKNRGKTAESGSWFSSFIDLPVFLCVFFLYNHSST